MKDGLTASISSQGSICYGNAAAAAAAGKAGDGGGVGGGGAAKRSGSGASATEVDAQILQLRLAAAKEAKPVKDGGLFKLGKHDH